MPTPATPPIDLSAGILPANSPATPIGGIDLSAGMVAPGEEEQEEIPGVTGFENTSASTSSGRGLPTANKSDVQSGLKREAAVGATIATLPFAPIISSTLAAAGAGALTTDAVTGGSMGFLQSVAEQIAKGENPVEFHHLSKTAQQTVVGMALGSLFYGAGKAGEAYDWAKGVARDVVQGSEVAQPGARAAVRTAVGAGDNEPLIEGGKSIVDEAVAKWDGIRSDLYGKAGEAAEAESENAPELLRQANQAHGNYMAARAFRQAVVSATDADGVTVKVPELLEASKNLRHDPQWGDQLVKVLGKDGADQYMEALKHARDMGAHAVTVQKIAKWAAGLAGTGALYEGIRNAKQAVTQ